MEPIQFIDIAYENNLHKDEIQSAISEVISSNDFIHGKVVSQFETSLATYLDVKHVIGVGNGTDALQISLLALGLKRGDEVILPSFTYFATAEAVAFLGMIPVLVDIDSETYTIDPACIERAITPKTKAIIPVHIYGLPALMEKIDLISKKHNLFVIEDAAQAIGASAFVDGNNQKVSTIGDLGCFSFYPAKNLGAFGDAGAIVTNNDELAKMVRMIANHGQSKKYSHEILGINSRLDSIQAAVLDVKLKYLTVSNRKRLDFSKLYTKGLSACDSIQLPFVRSGFKHVFHQYTILVKNGNRDGLKFFLETQGIQTRLYYPIAVHQQPALTGIAKIPFELINTKNIQESMLSLPMHTNLSSDQINYIIEKVQSFFN